MEGTVCQVLWIRQSNVEMLSQPHNPAEPHTPVEAPPQSSSPFLHRAILSSALWSALLFCL
ncbi:hypothetical protein SCLCIDRAFT_293525 [Scleroderma citrinum Foug A]|uniref:Uncharacterized protein n=1 Tax=Scleroderma citrinum Foug A TaxID=1036808 RepID=A0A0C3EEF9_9AGAM|nr:hypothetical protein SCLCIDRAFT_293525 [Scleroderma citrinum Foug A]